MSQGVSPSKPLPPAQPARKVQPNVLRIGDQVPPDPQPANNGAGGRQRCTCQNDLERRPTGNWEDKLEAQEHPTKKQSSQQQKGLAPNPYIPSLGNYGNLNGSAAQQQQKVGGSENIMAASNLSVVLLQRPERPGQPLEKGAWPANIETASIGYDGLLPIDEDLYFSSSSLHRLLASNNLKAIADCLDKPFVRQKIIINLKFYKPNLTREKKYEQSISPSIAENMAKEGISTLKFKSRTFHPGMQQLLRLLVQKVVLWMKIDRLIAFKFVARELAESGVLQKFLSDQFVYDLQNYLYDFGNQLLLRTNQNEIETILQNVCRAIAEDRKDLLDTLRILFNRKEKSLRGFCKQMKRNGLPKHLWQSYDQLSVTVYEVEGDLELERYLNQSILREELKLSKLLLEICLDETYDISQVIDPKEVVFTFDQQNLFGSAQRLHLDPPDQIQQCQHSLLLKLLPFRQHLFYRDNPNQASTKREFGWDRSLLTRLIESKSDQFLPYRVLADTIVKHGQKSALPRPSRADYEKMEKIVRGEQWIEWLEIWLEGQKDRIEDPDYREFTTNVFNSVVNNATRCFEKGTYSNIEDFWKVPLSNKDKATTFSILSASLGTSEHNFVKQTLQRLSQGQFSNILQTGLFKTISEYFLKEGLAASHRPHGDSGQPYYQELKFMCKCVVLNPNSVELLESILIFRDKRAKNSGGCYFIMFLLDCYKYYRMSYSLQCLKQLFRAFTALISNPDTTKKMAVCLRYQTYEKESSETFFRPVCEKLTARQTYTRDEQRLIREMLETLLTVLENESYYRLFFLENTNGFRYEIERQMAERHRGVYHLNIFQQSILEKEISSDCFLGLLKMLEIKPEALSYRAANALLINLLHIRNSADDVECRILNKGIEALNSSNMAKHLLDLFDMCKVRELPSSVTLISDMKNKRLVESIGEERLEVKQTLYNAVRLLNTIVKLLKLKQNQNRQSTARDLLDRCDLIQMAEDTIGGRQSIYVYRREVMSEEGWTTTSINIVAAIASLLEVAFSDEPKIELQTTILKGQDITEVEKLIETLDVGITRNPLYRPQFHTYLKANSLYIQVLRFLTELLLLWDGLSATSIKPSLSQILDSRPLNHIRLDMSCRSLSQRLWKLIVYKMHCMDLSFFQSMLSGFDFINCCLAYDTKLFEVLTCESMTKTTENLRKFMLEIFVRPSESNILAICKAVHMLNLLVSRVQTNPSLKACAHKMLFDDSLFGKIIVSLSNNFVDKVGTEMSNGLYANLSYEIGIMKTCYYYSAVSRVFRLAVYALVSGQVSDSGFVGKLLEKLYGEALTQKFRKGYHYGIELEEQLKEQMRYALKSRTTSEDDFFYHQKTEDEDSASQEESSLKRSVDLCLEVNDNGYGRYYDISVHQAYQLLSASSLEGLHVQHILSMICRYNCLKSLEDAKADALSNWVDLYSLLSSLGKDGYSFSDRLGRGNTVSLRELETHFPQNIYLINSKLVRLDSSITSFNLSRSQGQFTNSLYTSFCHSASDVLAHLPLTIREAGVSLSTVKRKERSVLLDFVTISQLAVRNLLLLCDDKQRQELMQKGFDMLLVMLKHLRDTLTIDCFELKEICGLYSLLCVLAQRIGSISVEQCSDLCELALTVYTDTHIRCRNYIVLAASSLLRKHLRTSCPGQFVAELVKTASKAEFDFMDFIVAVDMLTELGSFNPQLLVDNYFFDHMRKLLLSADFEHKENSITFHQVLLLVLRLISYLLMSERLETRMLSDISNFLLSFKDHLLGIVSVQQVRKIDYEPRFKLTSLRLRQNEYLINVVALLLENGNKLLLKECLQELTDALLYESALSNLNRLFGFDPQGEQIKLREVVPDRMKDKRQFQPGQFTTYSAYPPDQAATSDNNVFTLKCTIHTIKAVEAYLQFLLTLLNRLPVEKHWQQIERVLSTISRWLVVECQELIANEAATKDLLRYYCAYLQSAEHAVKFKLVDQWLPTYEYPEFVGFLGAVSYSCYTVGLRFLARMKDIQESHYKNFDLRNFKRALLNDASRTIDTFRHCEDSVASYLELPPEQLPVWTCLLDKIRYEQNEFV